MSEPTPSEPPTAGEQRTSRRKGPPAWGIVAFLVFLAGLVFVNQLASTGGAPIEWIENDLDAALQRATESRQRVFLYLYEPDDPMHKRNELRVFSQRWARKPLQHAVCCRVELGTGDIKLFKLRHTYGYHSTPLFLLLNAKGNLVGPPTDGAVDERQFFTYIGKPAEDYAKQSQ